MGRLWVPEQNQPFFHSLVRVEVVHLTMLPRVPSSPGMSEWRVMERIPGRAKRAGAAVRPALATSSGARRMKSPPFSPISVDARSTRVRDARYRPESLETTPVKFGSYALRATEGTVERRPERRGL